MSDFRVVTDVNAIIYYLLTKLADALATSRAIGTCVLRRALTGTCFTSALGLLEIRPAREARRCVANLSSNAWDVSDGTVAAV